MLAMIDPVLAGGGVAIGTMLATKLVDFATTGYRDRRARQAAAVEQLMEAASTFFRESMAAPSPGQSQVDYARDRVHRMQAALATVAVGMTKMIEVGSTPVIQTYGEFMKLAMRSTSKAVIGLEAMTRSIDAPMPAKPDVGWPDDLYDALVALSDAAVALKLPRRSRRFVIDRLPSSTPSS